VATKLRPRRASGAPVGAALTVIMLVLAVLAAGFVGDFSADPVVEAPAAVPEQPSTPFPTATGTPESLPDGERVEIAGDWAVAALLVLAMAGLALLVRFLLRFRAQRETEDGVSEQTDLHQHDPRSSAADALPAWTDAVQALLTSDADTSDVVIRCWLDLERLCATAGMARTRAQTTSDFAAAAATALDLPPDPLAVLTRLYQRARFGRAGTASPLGQDDRDQALTAVRELSAALPSRRTEAP
jgi:hypothetical protein